MTDTLISRLKQEIARQRFNYKSLSLAAGLGETTVRDIIMQRAKNPRRDTLQKIAQVLGKPPSYFFGDDADIKVPVTGIMEIGKSKKIPVSEEFAAMPPEAVHYHDIAAVRVKGSEFQPFLPDGSLIYYTNKVEGGCGVNKNVFCVVQLKKGDIVLATPKPMGINRCNLVLPKEQVLKNVEIDWCARIVFAKLS